MQTSSPVKKISFSCLVAMLLTGATSPFFLSWATSFAAWAVFSTRNFPISTWGWMLLIALYPIAVVDFHRTFLRASIRREVWYALAFTLALVILQIGTYLTPLPGQDKQWTQVDNLRFEFISAAFGTVIGYGIFFLLMIFGSYTKKIWYVIRKPKIAEKQTARWTVKSLLNLTSVVAFSLVILLSESAMMRYAELNGFGIDQASISIPVFFVCGLVSYLLGNWLRYSQNFLVMLAILPILATIAVVSGFLFFSTPHWRIRPPIAIAMILLSAYYLIMLFWNFCIRVTTQESKA